jgi:hypothetical protein
VYHFREQSKSPNLVNMLTSLMKILLNIIKHYISSHPRLTNDIILKIVGVRGEED